MFIRRFPIYRYDRSSCKFNQDNLAQVAATLLLLLLANFRHTPKSNRFVASPRAQYDRLITSINTHLRQTLRRGFTRNWNLYSLHVNRTWLFIGASFFTLHFSSSYRRRRRWDGRTNLCRNSLTTDTFRLIILFCLSVSPRPTVSRS